MKLWTWLALTPCVLACNETVESTDIRTSGVYPEVIVTANGNGSSEVKVWLKVGGRNSDTFMELRGDDELTATVDGTTKVLDETSGNAYRATFPVDAEGTEFVISFLRGDEDENAPESKVTMPAPFDLSLSATTASRLSDDVTFEWEPPATGNIDWSIDGPCIQDDDGRTPDDGSETIAAGDIETFESDMDETCTVDLEVVRRRSGTIDPAFTEGGLIEARHVRTESFTSEP